MIHRLDQIVEEARRRGARRLAVAYGQDEHTLEAVAAAWREGIARPTIYGEKSKIVEKCRNLGVETAEFTIVDEPSDVACVRMAVADVASGRADVLMKGLVSTDKYMRGILDKEAGLVPPKGVLSHVSVVQLPDYPRLLCIADVAVIPAPDFKQKTVLLKYLARTAASLGIEKPLIACIAPSEQVLPTVTSSTEAAILAKMADRGQLGKVVVDGPVAGKADCLLFPNIESGNVFFKSATHFGGAEIAAMVVGAKVPCVLTSRGDTSATKLYSIALACIN